MRLDIELVNRNLFSTRNKSQEAIRNGIVFCDGKEIKKPSFDVNNSTKIEIKGEVLKYVSRAGLKLEKAIQNFKISLNHKTMLDIGSSTGGFTDCALQMKAKKVIAVDVGTDVMDKTLRQNPNIELYENTDIRDINIDLLQDVEITTIDVSFIAVEKILSTLKSLPNLKEIVCLIKPQFECGKELADKYKGVVLDKKTHKNVILSVVKAFNEIGYGCVGLTPSPIKGGSGNIEYLSYYKKESMISLFNVDKIIDEAFVM